MKIKSIFFILFTCSASIILASKKVQFVSQKKSDQKNNSQENNWQEKDDERRIKFFIAQEMESNKIIQRLMSVNIKQEEENEKLIHQNKELRSEKSCFELIACATTGFGIFALSTTVASGAYCYQICKHKSS
jgi:hypothetical protein